MTERSDWSVLFGPTAILVVLILVFGAWDLIWPSIGLSPARSLLGDQLLLTAIIVAGGVLATRIAFVVARRRIPEPEDLYTFRKIAGLAVVLVATGLLVAVWIQVAETFLLSLGLVGAGLMLALAPVITGVAGWVHIVTTKPYTVGDRVEVGGVKGDIVDVKLLHTLLLEVGDNGPTGSVVQVPNRAVLDGKVVNDTRDFKFRWITIELPVSYGCDWRKARDLFRSILVEETGSATVHAKEVIRQLRGKYYLQKRDVAPVVSLSFDSNWILLKGRFVAPISDALTVRNRVAEAVITALEEHPEVEVGSESMTVTVQDGGS